MYFLAESRWLKADSPSMSAIHAEHVSHRYGERRAVDDLSLEIGLGEIFALLGPNGSGKTTMFRVLSTLVPIAALGLYCLFRERLGWLDIVRRGAGAAQGEVVEARSGG